jgi:hypothetical protein
MFGNIFSKPKTVDDILSDFVSEFFRLHGINSPSDGEIFRAYMNTCAISSGVLNHFSPSSFRNKIDELVQATQKRTKSLKLLVEEAVIDQDEIPKILSGFEAGYGVSARTTTNGYAAFLAFYETKFRELLNEIMNTEREWISQYPIVRLQCEVLGEEKARSVATTRPEVMVNAPMIYMQFIKDIIGAKAG